jgi:hypothetical protein
MAKRRCEVRDCGNDARMGIQFIVSSDERMNATRWLCFQCLPSALRTIADGLETVSMIDGLLRVAKEWIEP